MRAAKMTRHLLFQGFHCVLGFHEDCSKTKHMEYMRFNANSIDTAV